jgi:hypothetical protein
MRSAAPAPYDRVGLLIPGGGPAAAGPPQPFGSGGFPAAAALPSMASGGEAPVPLRTDPGPVGAGAIPPKGYCLATSGHSTHLWWSRRTATAPSGSGTAAAEGLVGIRKFWGLRNYPSPRSLAGPKRPALARTAALPYGPRQPHLQPPQPSSMNAVGSSPQPAANGHPESEGTVGKVVSTTSAGGKGSGTNAGTPPPTATGAASAGGPGPGNPLYPRPFPRSPRTLRLLALAGVPTGLFADAGFLPPVAGGDHRR